MSKIVIMSGAMIAAVLSGQPLMAVVFGSVMVTGLLAGQRVNESVRRVMDCPVLALRPALERLHRRPTA